MRKTIIAADTAASDVSAHSWLPVEQLARVELTSEEDGFPIESAFRHAEGGPGWRAGGPGEQTVRLLFDNPVRVRHVNLVFREDRQPRTQEFVLRWSDDGGRTYREAVRQQYTFSPPATTCETEQYDVDLAGLTAVELTIVPDISGGSARASIAQFCVAA